MERARQTPRSVAQIRLLHRVVGARIFRRAAEDNFFRLQHIAPVGDFQRLVGVLLRHLHGDAPAFGS